ncbi:MAG: tRNA (adenosine(37)-N6)-dimethylallyltransferase MiaA [Hyphomicrobiaceae bacterium]
MSTTNPVAVLISGPTASGKSAAALDLARERASVIINADSMQVYRELRILTARPSTADEKRAPHRLYGHVAASDAYSVSQWLADVGVAIRDAQHLGQCPIIVGGTGLYFKALTEGLSPVPAIPDEVRSRWREEARRHPAGLHEALRQRDPVMAARLAASDAQRLTRALEVVDATGVSLAEWQSRPGCPLLPADRCEKWLVVRSRDDLRQRCNRRFDEMMEMGALDEVRALMQLNVSRELPAMQALGVGPLIGHIEGRLTRDEAVARAKAETRQYVKRQVTWSRKFMADWRVHGI